MKRFIVENTIEAIGGYTIYCSLKSLQFMAFVMRYTGLGLSKSGPKLLSWSAKLKQYAIVNLESRELLEVSLDEDIVEPTQPEKQSGWEGHPPQVHVNPLSTENTGPHVENEVSEVTGDKPDSTEEPGSIVKDSPATLIK